MQEQDFDHEIEQSLQQLDADMEQQELEQEIDLMPHHALHAKELGFIHPRTGEKLFFTSEIPENFQLCIEK